MAVLSAEQLTKLRQGFEREGDAATWTKADLNAAFPAIADHAPVAPQFGFAGMDLGSAEPPPPPTGQPFRPRGMMIPGWAGGLTARIIAFDAGTDTITLDPALVVAPAAGDTFAILHKHVEAAGLTATEKAKLVTAARMIANKADHDVASGVNRYYDDAGTGVLVTQTPTETGGVVTVTPS